MLNIHTLKTNESVIMYYKVNFQDIPFVSSKVCYDGLRKGMQMWPTVICFEIITRNFIVIHTMS